ncbi:SAM-dependent methyltransferase [Mycobacterium sherrisii]|uniref:SAM-dependent methyltransferase n=1 Tax=Mycobacterium sherrisii TaxID=243061 RepID=A0A1E3SVW2_9MYCO|nr:methyltransferase domain-containing protein [Mycobacterium sherrisii]ODR06287.1 SAM-dependent methyltransferase [Mycobacterium sherrisii]
MSLDPVESTRGLLNRPAQLRHGFLDVLGAATSAPVPTVAQHAMNSPLVARVYERLWRPTAFYLASGLTQRAEQIRAASALRLSSTHRLLDVACGPGNFTAPLAAELPEDGLAVGFDISESMLTRAVADNSGPRTCYVRGDARLLPFGDDIFDAVCCFGALYLMPEPFGVKGEMVRVLKPGGRIAILTSYAPHVAPLRQLMTASARGIGLTMFDGHEFVDLFTAAGLIVIEQQTRRAVQFVVAAKPGTSD